MKKVTLVRPDSSFHDEIREYKQEFIDFKSSFNGDSGLESFEDINKWIEFCRLMEHSTTVPKSGWVEADQFMLVNENERHILGMINFRHSLNDFLAEYGGHIGYSVRPSERRKGYAKIMLKLCLEECKKHKLKKVLITCDKDNEASRRTILSCGGVFERIAKDDEKELERYWINLA